MCYGADSVIVRQAPVIDDLQHEHRLRAFGQGKSTGPPGEDWKVVWPSVLFVSTMILAVMNPGNPGPIAIVSSGDRLCIWLFHGKVWAHRQPVCVGSVRSRSMRFKRGSSLNFFFVKLAGYPPLLYAVGQNQLWQVRGVGVCSRYGAAAHSTFHLRLSL